MATKQRTIGYSDGAFFTIRLFHFIDNATDVTDYSCQIEGEAKLIWDSELSGGAMIFVSALSAQIDVIITGVPDILNMIVTKNPNYDSAYSNIVGKKVLYAYIYDKTQAEYYYLSLSEDMYLVRDLNGVKRITLTFTDGLERASHFTHLADSDTKNTTWTTRFATSTYYLFSQIVKSCIQDNSDDSDLRTWSLTIYDDMVNDAYPLEFAQTSSSGTDEFHEIYMKGDDICEGTDDTDIRFTDGLDLIRSICRDLFMILVSYGIGKFKLVPRFHYALGGSGSSAGGTQLNVDDFGKDITISFDYDVNTGINNTFKDLTSPTPVTYVRYAGITATDEYLLDTTYSETCKISTNNLYGTDPIEGNLYQDIIGTKYKVQCTRKGVSLAATGCSFWDVTRYQYYAFMDNTMNYEEDGYSGLTFTVSKPTYKTTTIQFGGRYYFTYNGIDYRVFVKKLTRNMKSCYDDIEFLSVKSLLLEDL